MKKFSIGAAIAIAILVVVAVVFVVSKSSSTPKHDAAAIVNAQKQLDDLGSKVDEPTATTTTTAAVDPTMNERGNIPKKLGEQAGMTSHADDPIDSPGAVHFAITKVQTITTCGNYGMKPKTGHVDVLVTINVKTGNDQDLNEQLLGVINPYSFNAIGKNGVTTPIDEVYCLDEKRELPNAYSRNSSYSGQIEMGVPNDTVALALNPGGMSSDGANGWEWQVSVG